MEQLRQQKAREFREREAEFEKEMTDQQARMADLDVQLQDLQSQRDEAIKKAQDAATSSDRFENANIELLRGESSYYRGAGPGHS